MAGSAGCAQKISAASRQQAELKQRQSERERQHQEALNSDTVSIDFAQSAQVSGNPNNSTVDVAQGRPTARPVSAETQTRKDTMAQYDFDGFQAVFIRLRGHGS